MIPFLIILALGVSSLTQAIILHDQRKNQKYNGWVSFIALIITWLLYYWAGFFDVLITN